MTDNHYSFNDPKLLFELWKELTGEDLLIDLTENKCPHGKSAEDGKKEIRSKQKETHKRRIK